MRKVRQRASAIRPRGQSLIAAPNQHPSLATEVTKSSLVTFQRLRGTMFQPYNTAVYTTCLQKDLCLGGGDVELGKAAAERAEANCLQVRIVDVAPGATMRLSQPHAHSHAVRHLPSMHMPNTCLYTHLYKCPHMPTDIWPRPKS